MTLEVSSLSRKAYSTSTPMGEEGAFITAVPLLSRKSLMLSATALAMASESSSELLDEEPLRLDAILPE
jgi:hypothetical protein